MFGISNAMLFKAFVLSFFFFVSATVRGHSTVAIERTFFVMGSEIALFSDRGDSFYDEASKSLQSFEKNISTWKKESRLSQFNQTSKNWVQFDQQSYQALKDSFACSKLTDGYFHPGLGQLIQLWGLRDKLKIPSSKEIELALLHTNLSSLTFNDSELKIIKRNKLFWFEEGGFAKGAAMDAIVKLAQKTKGDELFLNFSGQIYSEKKREVGIADPEKRDSVAGLINIEKESLSTSGISVQHFNHNNIIYGHVLNPKTGFPLSHTFKSMTVIHPENVWADCLSTGLLVMSENIVEFKKWMLAHPEIKVILLEKKEEKIIAETSCGLKNKIRMNPKVSQINENC